ncbi:MAG: sigma-54-dependent Fis family transcriptional regulator [Gammaproteobacteria bacterium]
MAPVLGKPSCQQIINILPDPFVVIDRNYRIIAANASYQRRYGSDGRELIGRHCYEVSHHLDAPCSRNGEHCPLETVLLTKDAVHVMHVHFNQEGGEELVQLHAVPLLDDDGNVSYVGEYVVPVNQRVGEEGVLVGRSRPLLRMISLLQRVAPTSTTVLLLGESGAGKERVAQYLHHYSNRANGPFVVVDCAALGEQLIESELFGYEKGAFTGANSRKVGLFEAAQGGTLFIDEVCELPLALQTKLLRVLETGTIRRIGGTGYIKVDVRVIVATNRNIQLMVERGGFRPDLYYRLSAFPVHVPSLRERKDDIPALAEHFLARFEDGDRQIPLAPEVIEALLDYDYPGNVRELRNIIERATILANDEPIRPEHLVFEGARSPEAQDELPGRVEALLDRRRSRIDGKLLLSVLEKCYGHRAQAARVLGISERTLYRHMRRLRIDGLHRK